MTIFLNSWLPPSSLSERNSDLSSFCNIDPMDTVDGEQRQTRSSAFELHPGNNHFENYLGKYSF